MGYIKEAAGNGPNTGLPSRSAGIWNNVINRITRTRWRSLTLKRWKKISTKTVYRNPWWTYKLDRFEIPGTYAGEYHYVHTNGSSMVIPVTEEGKIVLVDQYRYLCDRRSVEFPCGSVKDGHTYLETAQLELREETGYRANKLEHQASFNPYNGVTSEICKVFSAHELQTAPAEPDDTEELELVYRTPGEVEVMIRERTIWDGMTLAAWMLTRHLFLEKPRR